MRAALATAIVCLFAWACTTETETAIALAMKAKQCQDFEIARHAVLRKGPTLSNEQIAQAISLNRDATKLCSTSVPALTEQMQAIAP